MNGFERSSGQDAEADPRELLFPDDFLPDEIAIATELRDVFSVEREELPPLYIQTLMQHEWDGLATIERQQALMSIVFDRLGLPLDSLGSSLASVTASLSALATHTHRTRRDPHARTPRVRATRRMLATTLPKLRALPVVRALPAMPRAARVARVVGPRGFGGAIRHSQPRADRDGGCRRRGDAL